MILATASNLLYLASNTETHLVKTLHPIDEIAARISRADGDGVRLTHGFTVGANGDKNSDGENEFGSAADPAAAVVRALAAPLDFPPLSAGVVPGDRVAIAVDEAVPCVASVVRGVVEALQAAGVEPHDVSIVTSDAETSRRCGEELSEKNLEPQFIVHDPSDEKNLCIVGMTRRGQALLVNRTIFEADVVLLVSCAQVKRRSAYEGLFPRFSSADLVGKYRNPSELVGVEDRKRKRSETDEAGWMIGVLMTVQVVPSRGESVAYVLAGEPQAVAREGRKLCRRRWLLHSPQQVSLVVATITGGSPSQTWANVGRALATANRVLTENGAVAICSNLDEPPGQSLGRLIGSNDLEATARKISRDHEADSWAAWQLARALQRGPVYFLSQLSTDMLEDLGLAPIETVDDLVRLASRHESFVVVDDAQHAVVTICEEDER